MKPNITSYIKFPFQFNTEKLLQDLSIASKNTWILHFNTGGYEGDWKVISLYAPNGEANNIFAHSPENAVLKETPILGQCQYFKEVISFFKAPILSARILKLSPQAVIKPHRDYQLGYEDGCFRIHIPITTNKKVSFILNDNSLKMLPGECWYTNVNFIHSVANKGTTDRVHLVLDFERNEWSDALFFSMAPKESFRPMPLDNESPEMMRSTIATLKQSDFPIAKELIATLSEKLKRLEG